LQSKKKEVNMAQLLHNGIKYMHLTCIQTKVID